VANNQKAEPRGGGSGGRGFPARCESNSGYKLTPGPMPRGPRGACPCSPPGARLRAIGWALGELGRGVNVFILNQPRPVQA
jgi:hypothetical protein